MLQFLNSCLDAFDNAQANPLHKIVGCLLWLMIIAGFAACCLAATYIFR